MRREITDLGITVGEEGLNEEEGDLGNKVRGVGQLIKKGAKAEDGTQGSDEAKGSNEEIIADKVGTNIQKERVHSSDTGDDENANS